jgi:hypothetical protein
VDSVHFVKYGGQRPQISGQRPPSGKGGRGPDLPGGHLTTSEHPDLLAAAIRRVTPAVIDDIAYLAFLAEQLFAGQVAVDRLFEVAVVHHTQCGTGFLADPGFRHQAAEATGLAEAALEASAVADPHTTVKADVERLLTSPLLSPKVSVSGHVYDIATGRVTTTVDARYP